MTDYERGFMAGWKAALESATAAMGFLTEVDTEVGSRLKEEDSDDS